MAFELGRAVGQLKEAACCDRGRAIEGDVGTGEAREDELVIAGTDGQHKIKAMEQQDMEKKGECNLHERRAEVYLLVVRWLLVTYGLKCSGFHSEIDKSTIVFWYYYCPLVVKACDGISFLRSI
jgi:hypothetical protein